jgi:hypothetical protein
MLTILQKYASTKSIIILFIGVVIINIIFANALSSNVAPIDLQFSYSTEKAYQLLAAFSPEELNIYFWLEVTVDVIYPVIYTLLFSFSIYLLHNKNHKLSMIPIGIGFFDLLENICITIMIKNLPDQLDSLVRVSSIFTSLKWILTIVVMCLILYGLIKKGVALISK